MFSLLAGTLLLAGWLLERQGAVTATVATGIFITSYLFGGYFTLREAIGNIRAKRFEIDSLMLVAAIGAAARSLRQEAGCLKLAGSKSAPNGTMATTDLIRGSKPP